jgi:putative DNA primase/helicase
LLITPLVRSMMTTAPLHCVVAPEAGTGKSYLVDTAAAALLGYRCPVFSASTREEETEKRLAGSLIDGRPMISIDNVNGVLRGDLLCQAIVRPVVDVRPLGTSRKVRVENHATFVATGNNLRLEGDLTRRAILCYLDAGAARPELRAFTQSPFDEMLQDRGHVIAAALTLVRAYICSGSPNPAPRLASFEEWSDTVRSALIWLGCADPVETMEVGRADDPVRETFELCVAACRERYGERPFRAAELMQDAQAGHGGAPAYPSLHEAVFEIAHTGQRLDPSALAYWLRSHKGKVAEGYKLTNDGKKQANWRVVPLNRAQGMRASGAWRPES